MEANFANFQSAKNLLPDSEIAKFIYSIRKDDEGESCNVKENH